MATLLQGSIFWSYDFEVANRNRSTDFGYQFSGTGPFYTHCGTIVLKDGALSISGDVNIDMPLGDIIQLYLGFDEIYTPLLAKNFGLFWKPLRIKTNYSTLYIIIDYNFLFSKNKKWYNTIVQLLSP
ncbi:hypothetical protein FMM05_15730 [Flavobacterium zepuense]|uniref:Uncharacterized protein n=1 Tax=Flavobacterium zepuense TaxID=2593302 RepID=A0A552UWW4_9FLAO|nr:hypothetical protein [Flavobacterium zepuense]TRW22708.1 hypothetical protein FMM05_15730 [Flavobacterium zepuense]